MSTQAQTGPDAPSKGADLSLEAVAAASGTSVLDELMALARVSDEQRAAIESGLPWLIDYVEGRQLPADQLDVLELDLIVVALTAKVTRQIDEILHHPTFQGIESAWRGLKFVIDRVDFRENVRVSMLNVSKTDLLEDFQDAPEITSSGLYHIVYSEEFGQFGGRPYGLLIGNYFFSPLPQDMALLQDCASVATMAHAPFVAGVAPKFLNLKDWREMPQLSDLDVVFEGPQYAKWRAFRGSEDSRYVGLCVPRFLLRLPYGPASNRVQAFEYEERVEGHHERYLWGNAAIAFATRVASAFARYRWCINIVGPNNGGTVDNLPLHNHAAMGWVQQKIPTEVVITERRESELARQGFIPLTFRPDTANACFFSANSCQRPKTFGLTQEAKEAELNHKLGTQLPYLFMMCRIAHYLKVIQRENIGTWKERKTLE
ncbi:MAG: type VI secretion system contractile sheath large subunit, partial [Myxococcota bacterium]